MRLPIAYGLLASAQLGVPSAVAAIGLSTGELRPGQASAIVGAAAVTLLVATVGATRSGYSPAPTRTLLGASLLDDRVDLGHSAGVSSHAAAAAFAVACSGLVAPAMTLRDDRPRQQPRERELEQRVPVIARPRVERLDPVEVLGGERLLLALGGHAREPRARAAAPRCARTCR